MSHLYKWKEDGRCGPLFLYAGADTVKKLEDWAEKAVFAIR